MTFRIEKRIGIRATSERIWELIGDLETWKHWNAYETDVSGTIAFGGTVELVERIPGLPERAIAARVGEWQPLAQLVWIEKRGWQFGVTRYYEIEELEPGSCIVSNGFIFNGFRGEGFHDKHRKTIRAACEEICEALRRAAEA